MKIFRLFLSVLLFLFVLVTIASAQSLDTIATDDLVFTEVTDTLIDSVGVKTDASKGADSTIVKNAGGVNNSSKDSSVWAIFIGSFAGGLAALLMPCIFPMLPLTVSFFTKSSSSRKGAISKAFIYGISIIIIYVVLGLLVTILFGADALNDFSTNGIFNIIFFLLLVVFAVSLLGAFEITLPAKWVNAADSRSDTKGFGGLFFMAGTLALVSFSCTGPIIGALLVQAATTGALLGPAVGMFGFSLALAIPFTLFAIFPSWLKSLPKSGGWLNSVKVVMGFLELALAIKFLSNVDLAYHLKLLDRDIFIIFWIVIFGLLGLYLLGKIRLSHDSELKYLSVPRLLLSVFVFAFTLYLIPGLWGAPLKEISGYLPPQGSQDFDLYSPTFGSNKSESKHKYSDIFHAPLGLDAFFDYEEGLAYAKKVNKPIMIDFTGNACANCREMEASVWSEKNVLNIIKDKYVLIQLYVDDKQELAKHEQTVLSNGKKIRTIGNKWSNFQASRFGSNSQPFYVLVSNTENILVPPIGAEFDADKYLKFLQSGLLANGAGK